MMTASEQRYLKSLRQENAELRKQGHEFFDKILNRDTRVLFTYAKERIGSSWSLEDVWERTMAAQALGFNTIIRADDKGLHIDYAKTLPTARPYRF